MVFLSFIFECLDFPVGHELDGCSHGFSNESRRNKMSWFADLNRISSQAYRNYRIRFVVDDKYLLQLKQFWV